MYNSKVDIKVVNQIALNNSGLQIQLNSDTLSKIHYLNMKAASEAQNNVNGKMTIAVNEITLKESKFQPNSISRIVTNQTAKDKNGSNPFYHGELLGAKGQASNKNEEITDENKLITTSVFV